MMESSDLDHLPSGLLITGIDGPGFFEPIRWSGRLGFLKKNQINAQQRINNPSAAASFTASSSNFWSIEV
jgi:hypothetical protein